MNIFSLITYPFTHPIKTLVCYLGFFAALAPLGQATTNLPVSSRCLTTYPRLKGYPKNYYEIVPIGASNSFSDQQAGLLDATIENMGGNTTHCKSMIKVFQQLYQGSGATLNDLFAYAIQSGVTIHFASPAQVNIGLNKQEEQQYDFLYDHETKSIMCNSEKLNNPRIVSILRHELSHAVFHLFPQSNLYQRPFYSDMKNRNAARIELKQLAQKVKKAVEENSFDEFEFLNDLDHERYQRESGDYYNPIKMRYTQSQYEDLQKVLNPDFTLYASHKKNDSYYTDVTWNNTARHIIIQINNQFTAYQWSKDNNSNVSENYMLEEFLVSLIQFVEFDALEKLIPINYQMLQNIHHIIKGFPKPTTKDIKDYMFTPQYIQYNKILKQTLNNENLLEYPDYAKRLEQALAGTVRNQYFDLYSDATTVINIALNWKKGTPEALSADLRANLEKINLFFHAKHQFKPKKFG